VENELRNAADSEQDVARVVFEVPVVGQHYTQCDAGTRRVLVMGARQRDKPAQRQWDLCAAGIEACCCRAYREGARPAACVNVS
jgi:hypothetical protein